MIRVFIAILSLFLFSCSSEQESVISVNEKLAAESTGEVIQNGTAQSPFLIDSVEKLKDIDKTKYSKLTADIDVSSFNWVPIGDNIVSFQGVLDGNGYKIKGLKFSKDIKGNVGLFGVMKDARISNLFIEIDDVDIASSSFGVLTGVAFSSVIEKIAVNIDDEVSGKNFVGGLVGYAENSTGISDCSVIGDVKGNIGVGGLVGYLGSGSSVIASFTSDGSAVGKIWVGGIAGLLDNAQITNTYSLLKVKGDSLVGGLVGALSNYSNVAYSYAVGDIAGNFRVGGLVGFAGTGKVQHSVALNKVVNALAVKEKGRVIGDAIDTEIINNYAFKDMLLSGEKVIGGVQHNINGADVASSALSASFFTTNQLGWNNLIWNTYFVDRDYKLPLLNGSFHGDIQPDEMPEHLKSAAIGF